jgi:cell division protein FtsW
MSREKWGYLPAADNDFIFAILGEEFGLIGTLLVLVAFTMMLIAVSRIVRRHKDPFAQIASAAIGAWLIGQAFVNIAVVLELLPVTGIPLPLVSSGGSSLVASLAAIGALMAFARSEPGAKQAFSARPSVMRRSIAVMARGRVVRGNGG